MKNLAHDSKLPIDTKANDKSITTMISKAQNRFRKGGINLMALE